ncbi:MAG: hypothetical protein KAT66_06120 [Candidatus Lokiarchaeota archaeon]|nr:hypothetical protein [Candidatus Lokiarchaeota archaeon]
MIYSLFLYQRESGLLLYNKVFQDVSDGKLEMFGAFFSAIKSYISEILLEGSKELRMIELGDYIIFTSLVPETNSDLVIIANKEDYKLLKRLFPKIIKIILNHKELFIEWRADVNEFLILDQPLTDLIHSKKQLLGESGSGSIKDFSIKKILKSISSQKREVSEQSKLNLIKERDYLISRLKRVNNYFQKLTIIEKLIEISENVKDNDGSIKYRNEAKILRKKIEDTKIKLNFFLNKVKTLLTEAVNQLGNKSLKEGDYNEAYLNLYSFTQKLTNLSSPLIKKKYQELARKLSNKDNISDNELSQTIALILNMDDKIEEYFE